MKVWRFCDSKKCIDYRCIMRKYISCLNFEQITFPYTLKRITYIKPIKHVDLFVNISVFMKRSSRLYAQIKVMVCKIRKLSTQYIFQQFAVVFRNPSTEWKGSKSHWIRRECARFTRSKNFSTHSGHVSSGCVDIFQMSIKNGRFILFVIEIEVFFPIKKKYMRKCITDATINNTTFR